MGVNKMGLDPGSETYDKFKPPFHPQPPKDKVSLIDPHLTTKKHKLKHLMLFLRILAVIKRILRPFPSNWFLSKLIKGRETDKSVGSAFYQVKNRITLLDKPLLLPAPPALPTATPPPPAQISFYIFPANLQPEK